MALDWELNGGSKDIDQSRRLLAPQLNWLTKSDGRHPVSVSSRVASGESKHGSAPDELDDVLNRTAVKLRIVGLMTMAPFERLIQEELQDVCKKLLTSKQLEKKQLKICFQN